MYFRGYNTLNKVNVQLTTYIGLIPFYLPFVFIFSSDDKYLFQMFSEIAVLYGAMIVSFVSGMQWEKIVTVHSKYSLIPIIPFSLAWLHFLNLYNFFAETIIIFSLIANLLIDCYILNDVRKAWFKKMRFIVTIMACSSYVLNFFST